MKRQKKVADVSVRPDRWTIFQICLTKAGLKVKLDNVEYRDESGTGCLRRNAF